MKDYKIILRKVENSVQAVVMKTNKLGNKELGHTHAYPAIGANEMGIQDAIKSAYQAAYNIIKHHQKEEELIEQINKWNDTPTENIITSLGLHDVTQDENRPSSIPTDSFNVYYKESEKQRREEQAKKFPKRGRPSKASYE